LTREFEADFHEFHQVERDDYSLTLPEEIRWRSRADARASAKKEGRRPENPESVTKLQMGMVHPIIIVYTRKHMGC
jgi:hypothetical protein